MQISLLLMQQIAQLFLILLMGYAVVKTGLLKASDSKVLSVVFVYLVMPCVVLNAFQIKDTPEIRTGLLYSMGIAVGMHVVFLLLNALFRKALKLDAVEQVNIIYSNAAALVIPIVQPLLILTDTWKEFGYGSIVYLAAITSIDSTLYEAASIDGATWWKKVWHVTLPGIRTTIVLMAVMNLGNILNAGFDQVYNLYSASVYATGDILDTYVYRVGLQGLQYSFGTAVGLLKSVIAFVLMIGANKLAQKYTDSKIF